MELLMKIPARENIHPVVDRKTFRQSHEASPEEATHCTVNPEHRICPLLGALTAKEAIGTADVENRFSSQAHRHLHRVPFVDAQTLTVAQLLLIEHLVIRTALQVSGAQWGRDEGRHSKQAIA